MLFELLAMDAKYRIGDIFGQSNEAVGKNSPSLAFNLGVNPLLFMKVLDGFVV